MNPAPTAHRAVGATIAAFALALAATLAGCGGVAPTTVSSPIAGSGAAPASLPAEVDVATAASLVANGAFLLDVREPDEWVAGHVKGATLIPLGELANRVSEVPTDRQVVVMCRSGNRSAQGRDILLGAGWAKGGVTSMAGGISAWAAAGRPVTTGE